MSKKMRAVELAESPLLQELLNDYVEGLFKSWIHELTEAGRDTLWHKARAAGDLAMYIDTKCAEIIANEQD